MKSPKTILILSVAVALPAAAIAQSNAGDAKYCAALTDSYQRYAQASQEHKGTRPPPADVADAISKCQSAPASSIPVLEKALNDAKVNLPPRT